MCQDPKQLQNWPCNHEGQNELVAAEHTNSKNNKEDATEYCERRGMRPEEDQSYGNEPGSVNLAPAIAPPHLPLSAAWLLRKSLLWERESLRDGLSRAAQRAKKCLRANGTAASVAVHKNVSSIRLNRTN